MKIPQHTKQIIVLAFGFILICVVLGLSFARKSLTDQQFELLRIVLALAGSAFAVPITGFLNVKIKSSKSTLVQAGGALAVFTVIYFVPVALSERDQKGISQHTEGTNSPNINGNENNVNGGNTIP